MNSDETAQAIKGSGQMFPDWTQEAIHELNQKTSGLTNVMAIYIEGLTVLKLNASKAFDNWPNVSLPPNNTRVEVSDIVRMSESLNEFLRTEMDAGNPFLSKIVVSEIWSGLESFFRSLVARSMWETYARSGQQGFDVPPLSLIRCMKFAPELLEVGYAKPLFEQAANALGRKLNIKTKKGQDRFETWISPFEWANRPQGLSRNDALDLNVQQLLSELHIFRDCLQHRNGLVDVKVVRDCSTWLPLKIGQRIPINLRRTNLYVGAAMVYPYDILQRIMIHAGRVPAALPDEIYSLYDLRASDAVR